MDLAYTRIACEALATFGDLLKHLRRRAQMTQRDLALATGYSVGQICRFEQNQRLPDLPTLTALFVPALDLEEEPAVVERLLALAAAARGERLEGRGRAARAVRQEEPAVRDPAPPPTNLPGPWTSLNSDAMALPIPVAWPPPGLSPSTEETLVVAPNPALPAHQAARTDRNRRRMLEQVKKYWITGMLEQSLHGAALIELGLAYQQDAVERPWDLIVQQPDQPECLLPTDTPMIDVYDALDGELLILGAPGAGKTTLLLDLTRVLIARAEQDSTHPMPIVFNLSSWAAQRRLLADWLIDELSLRYQVPRALGQAWVEADQVLPLLDGLDEVALEQRMACVDAINQFREAHWLLDMVVCSRSADYAALTSQLRLQGAVVVQPLTAAQVNNCLQQAGEALAPVRALIQADAVLRELVDTPLMLSIMVLAYQGLPVETLPAGGSLDEQRRHLFDAYVQRMLGRRNADMGYSAPETLHWLSWLAGAMVQRSQTIFFIEGLQPDWLACATQRRYYILMTAMLVGLLSGVVDLVGLVLFAAFVPSGLRLGLPSGLIQGLFLGPVNGVVFGLVCGRALSRHPPATDGAHDWWRATCRGLSTGVIAGLAVGTVGGLLFGRIGGLA
jgi:transcriptional regulator with XRE-family HTH domain